MSGTRQVEFTVSGQSTDWTDPDAARVYIERVFEPVFKRVRNTLNQLARDYVLIKASGNVAAKYGLVLADATAGNLTLSLVSPSDSFHPVVVVKVDSTANTVTVRSFGNEAISGASTDVLVAQWQASVYEADATQWYKFSTATAIAPGSEGQVYYTHNGSAQWGYAPYQVLTTSANVTCPSNCIMRCESVSSNITVKLPASPLNGEWVQVIGENASAWNITVDGNGHNLANAQYPAAATSNLVFDGEAVTFVYVATDGVWRTQARYVPRIIPALNTHGADANTVALWQGDPPGNSGSGLVDSSGNGLTLAMGAGTERYGTVGHLQEGFLCDGTNYWIRAGSVNDASLNLVGDMTIECIARTMAQPAGLTSAAVGGCIVNYGAVGETGGNDNVFWQLGASNTTASGPNMATMWSAGTFWETGAGVNRGNDDQAIIPLNMPVHLAAVRSASGDTWTFYVDGARQKIITGNAIGTVGGAPTQFVHIGADHNAAEFFVGVVASIKISNVARSDGYIAEDAARCIGIGRRLVP